MSKNKFLKVWALGGYYDLATPFYSAEWFFNHVFVNDETEKNFQFTHYPCGHMIYMQEECLAQFRKDAEKWYAK
jgi:carboxypeptidase C (cathepsin A)